MSCISALLRRALCVTRGRTPDCSVPLTLYEMTAAHQTGCAVPLQLGFAWFCDYLPVPSRFGIVTRKSRRGYAGVCWFRDDARNTIMHARTLAVLIGEAGVPIAPLTTGRPGDIVYRDAIQIVAMPHAQTPVRWH